MVRQIQRIASSPLIAGSFIVFAGGLLSSFLNFLFTILMNRNLSVSDFGILIALISIITLLMVPSSAISPTIVTLAGRYFAHKDYAHLNALYTKMFKSLFIFGTMIFIIFLIFAQSISHFFKIGESYLVALSILCVVLFYFSSLNASFMQAKLSFKFLSFSNSISAFLKVSLSFLFVFLGFGVGGAMVGFMLSIFIVIIIGIYYFRSFIFYKPKDIKRISFGELLSYGIPSALIMLCLSSLVSSDILLVKHLFSPHDAGLYAGLSLVGKVIFFLSAPIGTVMFPMLVEKFEKKEEYDKIFYLSFILVTGLSLSVVIFYYFFPNFSINFFVKKAEYLAVSQYLFKFSIFITLYSLVSLVSYYFLSIKKLNFAYIILIGSIMQVVLIYYLHTNFDSIINISIVSCVFILLSSLVLFKSKK